MASSVQRFYVTITSTAMRPADGSAIARPRVDAIPREGRRGKRREALEATKGEGKVQAAMAHAEPRDARLPLPANTCCSSHYREPGK